jgi:hypothetical protein
LAQDDHTFHHVSAPPVEWDAPEEITDDNLTEMPREHIMGVLPQTGGVLWGADRAASRLGIKRTTLQSMLKRFGIELPDYRRGSGTLGPGQRNGFLQNRKPKFPLFPTLRRCSAPAPRKNARRAGPHDYFTKRL